MIWYGLTNILMIIAMLYIYHELNKKEKQLIELHKKLHLASLETAIISETNKHMILSLGEVVVEDGIDDIYEKTHKKLRKEVKDGIFQKINNKETAN